MHYDKHIQYGKSSSNKFSNPQQSSLHSELDKLKYLTAEAYCT